MNNSAVIATAVVRATSAIGIGLGVAIAAGDIGSAVAKDLGKRRLGLN